MGGPVDGPRYLAKLVLWASIWASWSATMCLSLVGPTRELLNETTSDQGCQHVQGVVAVFLTSSENESGSKTFYTIKITSPTELEGTFKRLQIQNASLVEGVQTGDMISVTICEGDLRQITILPRFVKLEKRSERIAPPPRIPTTGSIQSIVVPVRFCGNQTISRVALQNLLFQASQTSTRYAFAQYISTCSYGEASFGVNENQVLDVVDICPDGYRNQTYYQCNVGDIGWLVQEQLKAKGVTISDRQHLIMVHPDHPSGSCLVGEAFIGCFQGMMAKYGTACYMRITYLEEGLMMQGLLHEMGHNFGLAHAYWEGNKDPYINKMYGDYTACMGLTLSNRREYVEGLVGHITYYPRCHNPVHNILLRWARPMISIDISKLNPGMSSGTYRLAPMMSGPSNTIVVTNTKGSGYSLYLSYRTVTLPYDSPVFNDWREIGSRVDQASRVMLYSYNNSNGFSYFHPDIYKQTWPDFSYRMAALKQTQDYYGSFYFGEGMYAYIRVYVINITKTYADVYLQIAPGGWWLLPESKESSPSPRSPPGRPPPRKRPPPARLPGSWPPPKSASSSRPPPRPKPPPNPPSVASTPSKRPPPST